MKNKLFLLSFFMLAFAFVNAQKNTTTLVSSSDTETVIKFNVDSYDLQTVTTPNGKEVVITAEDASQLMIAQSPDLAKFTKSIIIPDASKMQIEVVASKFKEIDIETNIAPSKGNLLRTVNPNDIPYIYGEVYNQNKFFPGELANLNTPYIARDFRGQAVNIYPFQYNPTTKKLRIYTEITVKISATTETGENVFNRTRTFDKVAREFNNIYSNHFINYNNSRYTPVLEEGNMLIICYDDWTDEMQALVDWKNTIGRPCEMVTVTEAGGSSSAIATYVEDYYNDNGLTYLLLVGDASQVPTNSGAGLGGDSDNAYAYITGSDHYLEFFVGRFSAETAAHVSTQVQRTITYENGSTLEDSWLNTAMGVASALGDGQGDDGEADFVHYRNMATDLLAFTYAASRELFDGSQGGNDASGDPTPTTVGDEINNGAGVITYTGHGGDFLWVTSGFDIDNVNALTNNNKLPFIFDVACVNGNFVGQTCFGESWLRAENGGEPTGAIAIVASTINQSWAPPMDAQDEMVDLVVGTSTNGIKRTFTGITVNGMFQMNDDYSDWNMTDTWTTFGDPSVLIRTDNTSDMNISHNPTILVGETTFVVNCDFDGAFACLSKDGIIYGTATVTGGVANIPFGDVNPGEEITLAITGFNKVTYLTTITVIAPSGPYLTVGGFEINGENSIDYSQSGNINITLTNVGPEQATGVTATLTTSDEYVTSLTNNTDINFETIAGDNGTAISSGSFSITVANNVPDQHVINFELIMTDESKATYEGTINITANAPSFEITGMTISNDTDGNGRLDPAETADLTFTVNNTGQADASDILANLLGNSPYFQVLDNNQSVSINSNGTLDIVFNVEANENAAQGTLVNLTMNVEKNIVYTASFNQELTIGQAPEIVVGTGTEPSGSYPFYTYYKNNKSQILYLGSEIGAGENLIQEFAFDFYQIGAVDIPNLTIKFKEVTITELGTSYEDMSDATTVLSATTYTMPIATGWHNFDIEDFNFNGTNNLLIEIDWGTLANWEDNYYRVNCTTTPSTSVVSGFGDDVQHPNYSSNNNKRPNATFFFEASTSGTEYVVNFIVQDDSGNPVTDAVVCVGSQNNAVDNFGETSFNLIEGNYSYTAYSGIYATKTEDFTVDEEENITIILDVLDINETSNNINIYPNPSNGLFNIKLENTNSTINIYNINGQLIVTQETNNSNTTIDLSSQAKGVYFIKITSEGNIFNDKIIIK